MSKLPVLTAAGLMAGFLLFARADSQMMHEPPPGPGAQGKAMDIRTCPEPMGKRMHAGFGFYLNLADRLKLTQAQVEQLSSMKFEYQKADIQRRAGLQTSELELRQLRGADDVDAKKVEAAIRDLHGKMAEQEIAALRAQTEARKVLTADQRATLKGLGCPDCGGACGKVRMECGMMRRCPQGEAPSPGEQYHPK